MVAPSKRLITINNKTYDGVRNIVVEIIKRAPLNKFTYEDVILAADGKLAQFGKYLTDQGVKQALWALQYNKVIKRVARKGQLGIYTMADNTKKEPGTVVEMQPKAKNDDEITATEFGERLIRYIGILKQNVNKLEAELREEKSLHGKALSAWKEEQSARSKLEAENKELLERVAALSRKQREEASSSTFKLSELIK